ncbi:TPA: sporulation transcriptional regulator SpoIIID [Yersinia enterocolitica]|nr:sporulation transcriptional regulator SpoIIID [Yersinia enterocolitica]HDL6961508.1 sporulation transcriptional regulator SpoIIID [Yersinia enterocolitica]HDL6983587.1 sporulation transcriptional regulator SpoIIID [Yersinia enterocolitica]HDL7066704.1 sporulation transcriptional regulator SpoIIID [Yersinia enterocolitica]HDL7071090.1 sporulation transcriptional regulator SpoIIID [Yersinia enterocolitica]
MVVTLEGNSHRVIRRISGNDVLNVLNIRQLAKLFGISESTVHYRMKENNMSLEDALTTPLQSK